MLSLLKVWSNECAKKSFSSRAKRQGLFIQNRTKLLLLKRLFGQYMYGGPLQLHFFLKIVFSNSLYLKKWQCRRHDFRFQLTLTINITPINFSLSILEKKLRVPREIYKVMLKLILIFGSLL